MPLKSRNLLYTLILTLFGTAAIAQTPANITVQISATAQASPPRITLHWPADANATAYNVYRKSKTAVGWGSLLASVAGTDTTFSDTTVALGDAWEYRISKTATGYTGQGYCYAGLETPAQDDLGKLILVIDTTYAQNLAPEIDRLTADLWGDGWQVTRLNVARTDSVTGIHDRIQTLWMADPTRVRTVFLLGHVPVPYSGNLNPDGHPDHQGAWPADVYYGEMNGVWTDQNVNNSNAARPANQNTIGDGKFDQSSIPSDMDLEVGRVDFANMPAFAVGEEALLRRYLDKDHAWRMKAFTVQDSAVIDDNFGFFGGEAFASSGWRNCAPLVGARHTYAGDFRTALNARDHLWAYGCGGGWYQGASGVGATSDFAGDSLRGVFSMIFGSYHGDWDSDDNFMRAALASKGHILSSAWAGRPNWHFQHMGLGEPIGYSAKVTQNNFSLYLGGYGTRNVHIALMGDPSLRMHICAPPSNLTVTLSNGGNSHELNWTASPELILGYAIYRQDTLNGRYLRIGMVGLNTTSYTDSCRFPGDYRYMVRAEELRTGYSGSYHNLSQGIMGTITNTSVYAVQADLPLPMTFCAGDTVSIPYTTVDDFCSGNSFTAEISDSAGNFTQAQVLGNAFAVSSGDIAGVIPSNLLPATGYRIRVTATNPAMTGADNGADLTIGQVPVASYNFSFDGNTYDLTNTSIGATRFLWIFGNGDTSILASPSYTYYVGGIYNLRLIAYSPCGSDTLDRVSVIIGVEDAVLQSVIISPNPTRNWFEISDTHNASGKRLVKVFDLMGHEIVAQNWSPATTFRIATSDWTSGIYIVEIQDRKGTVRRKMVVQ